MPGPVPPTLSVLSASFTVNPFKNVCPGSLDPFFIGCYYMKWARFLGHTVHILEGLFYPICLVRGREDRTCKIHGRVRE